MTTLDDLTAKRPPNWDAVAAHEERMLSEVRAYKLKELREQLHLTQVELAKELEVTQKRVSAIERGDIDRAQVDTLRRYVEALGGSLEIAVQVGGQTFKLA